MRQVRDEYSGAIRLIRSTHLIHPSDFHFKRLSPMVAKCRVLLTLFVMSFFSQSGCSEKDSLTHFINNCTYNLNSGIYSSRLGFRN